MAYVTFTGDSTASNGTSLAVLSGLSQWSSQSSDWGTPAETGIRSFGFANDTLFGPTSQSAQLEMSTTRTGKEIVTAITGRGGTSTGGAQIVNIVGLNTVGNFQSEATDPSNVVEANRIVNSALLGVDHFDVSGAVSRIWGDIATISSGSNWKLGDDTFRLHDYTAASGVPTVFGDAQSISGKATVVAGDDIIRVSEGSVSVVLYGDFQTVSQQSHVTYGNDDLYGNNGIDTIYGDSVQSTGAGGKDNLFGLSGADVLYGGGGDDVLEGGFDADSLNGGAGFDIAGYSVNFSYYTTVMVVDLSDAAQNTNIAEGDTFTSIEGLRGRNTSSYGDDLRGDSHNNKIWGLAGADILTGRGGKDMLYGGTEADSLYGGTGSDILTGGAGADNFYFDTALTARNNVDTITDFKSSNGDRLVLSEQIFTALNPHSASLSAAAFYASNAGIAHDRNDRIIYEKDTGNLFYDPDGNGAAKATLFAVLSHHPALSAGDFDLLIPL